MSQDAKNLYQAQQEAASMAEILEKDIDSLDNISVYYDKDWNQCDKEEKMYWLEVTQAQNQAQEDDLKKVKIKYRSLIQLKIIPIWNVLLVSFAIFPVYSYIQ